MTEKSIAHRHDPQAHRFHPDDGGLVPWRDATPPNIEAGATQGRMRSCQYCGSMHPADLATAIRAGAVGHMADQKYGWPHKAYFDGVPYPFAGMLESYHGHSSPPQEEIDAGKWVNVPNGFSQSTGKPKSMWFEAGKPANDTTHAKFYTVHLQDATPADKETIEMHLGIAFEFIEQGVSWEAARPYYEKRAVSVITTDTPDGATPA